MQILVSGFCAGVAGLGASNGRFGVATVFALASVLAGLDASIERLGDRIVAAIKEKSSASTT